MTPQSGTPQLFDGKCKVFTISQVSFQSGSVGSSCHVFLGVSLNSVASQSFINVIHTTMRKQRSLRSELQNIIGGESETIISPQWWRSIYAQRKVFTSIRRSDSISVRTDCARNELHEKPIGQQQLTGVENRIWLEITCRVKISFEVK